MKITILEVGRAPVPLSEQYPSYPEMFASLLGGLDPDVSFDVTPVLDGAPLPDPSGMEAVLITGSPAGVYDQLPWMEPLRDFVRRAAQARLPMVGVCFGHQIIADALGGDVRKSEKGWGVGRHVYDLVERRDWMLDADRQVALSVSHQDQVITPPPGAVTIARSSHTEHAMLAYSNVPIFSVQGHPEFTDAFVASLYGARRGGALSDDVVDAAVESLARPHDNEMLGAWILSFIKTAQAERRLGSAT